MRDVTQVLELARKVAEEAEVFSTSVQTTTVQFEANELKQVQARESQSTALRIFKAGRIGFAVTNGAGRLGQQGAPSSSLSRRGRGTLGDLVEMAVETSQFGSPANFDFPSIEGYPEVPILDPKVEEVAMQRMVEIGKELIDRIRTHTPEILCDVRVTKGTTSVSLANSRGSQGKYEKSFFGFRVEGVLVRDTDILWVGDSQTSCRLADNTDEVADYVIWQLEMARRKATPPTRVLPTVFTPHGVANVLLGPVILGLNGKTVLEGASPLRGKLGEQVFDKRLNLWDDATVAYGVGSYPFDDEGVPGGRLPLVANGIVMNFLYDLQTAALAGTGSTGNGRRAGGVPAPAISSLVLKKGDMPFQAMVKDMKEGLVVQDVIGAEQGNILGGDFSGNVLLGYKVEHGEIVGRVKDTMIAGNVYHVLKELCGIGEETRWVDGAFQVPALYCPAVSVAAKRR